MAIEISERSESIIITVRVVPRAGRTGLAGVKEGMLRVRVSAPPVRGAANEELRRFLAKLLAISASSVAILTGHSSRTKRVELTGVTALQIRNAVE